MNSVVKKVKATIAMLLACVFMTGAACNTYTVTFADCDGGVLKTETVMRGDGATAPEAPDRDGYTFVGWGAEYDEIFADTVLTATYLVNEYAVTFVDHDGTLLNEQVVEHGSAAVAPASPSRVGHTFVGWNGTYDCITADTNLTAVYEVNTHTVTFKDYDGTVISSETYNYGDAVTVPANPARNSDGVNNYSFAAWDSEVSETCVADATYTATYTAKRITCSYCGDGDHTTKRCAKKSVAGGAVGRWSIPSVGVDVACYASWAQSVCDAKDSACYFALGSQKVIADHKHQGFNAIKKCKVGTVAYVDTGSEVQKYVCTGVIQGHNVEGTLTDDGYNSIDKMNPGGITCYTCNDCWQNITIVFFQPAN